MKRNLSKIGMFIGGTLFGTAAIVRQVADITVSSESLNEIVAVKKISNALMKRIYSLTMIGIIVCICALYVSVKMMIDENHVNISMLKVLGMKEKEINRMILSGNHLLLPIGIISGIVLAVKTMDLISDMFAEMASMILPPYISGTHVISTVVIVCLCYFGSLTLVKRKTSQINMVESMKDNRE